MAERTEIAWCDSTFNPWIGCMKVSTSAGGGGGCDHCYAEVSTPSRVLRASGRETWGPGALRQRTSDVTWKLPRLWNGSQFVQCRACGWRGEERAADWRHSELGPSRETWALCPSCKGQGSLHAARRRVFCASLADVFDNEVDPAWRADLFSLIADTPNLNWLLLTKRIGNAERMIDEALKTMWNVGLPWPCRWPWPNVWLGATVVNQAEADRDVPKLLATPAAVRFLSIEPMLGPINLGNAIDKNPLHGHFGCAVPDGAQMARYIMPPSLDWIIAGGESGPHARLAHPDWFRALRDQCAAAGVPFLFKQWGEWVPYEHSAQPPFLWSQHGHEFDAHGLPDFESEDGQRQREWHIDWVDQLLARRVGKKAAGRLLDGVEHNDFPESA